MVKFEFKIFKMNQKIGSILIFFVLLFQVKIAAQVDSTVQELPDQLEEIIENFAIEAESESDFDFNGLEDDFQDLLRNPINLNTATFEDLDFGILSPLQIQSLLNHRILNGDFINLYELQSINNFDLQTIKSILPFFRIGNDAILKRSLNLKSLIENGESQLFLRWIRFLEPQRGYQLTENGYLGDPNNFFLKYKWTSSNRVQFGITAEKDRGEEFFAGSNKYGFDFYSGHLFFKNIHPNIKAIALGDFGVALGQGLILRSGFARAKGAQVLNIKNTVKKLKPYTSVNEFAFFRGAGFDFNFKSFNLFGFISSKKIDGNIVESGINSEGDSTMFISSFLASGFHRTESEIEDEKSTTLNTIGASIGYKKNRFKLNANFVYDQFDQSFTPSDEPYNLFRLNGDKTYNSSLDYTYYLKNLHFFGEAAVDDNQNFAISNGLLLGLGKYANASFLFRHFDKGFYSLNGQPFSETRRTTNETGLYSGLSIKLFKNVRFDGYYDFWEHSWLRSRADAPSNGNEWLAKLSYIFYKKGELYLQYRSETKGQNKKLSDSKFDFLSQRKRESFRIHFAHKLNKQFEWRNRVEWSFFNKTESRGFLIYQDFIWSVPDFPLKVKSRIGYFDTDDFDSRIYTYENEILNAFSIPPYSGKGSRFYLYLRYTGIDDLSIEARYGNTFVDSDEGFGAGRELIEGKNKSDVKFQIKWDF